MRLVGGGRAAILAGPLGLVVDTEGPVLQLLPQRFECRRDLVLPAPIEVFVVNAFSDHGYEVHYAKIASVGAWHGLAHLLHALADVVARPRRAFAKLHMPRNDFDVVLGGSGGGLQPARRVVS